MGEYDDIINIKRPVSKHKKISISERAAMFNPFQAMTGYDDCIIETNRYVESRIPMTDDLASDLNQMIQYILLNDSDEYSITYFIKDKLKDGGIYETKEGIVSKININDRFLIIDNTKILFDDLYTIKLI